MSPEEFERRLHTIHRRFSGLARGDAPPHDETIADLRATLEELRVAEEELRQQKEELVAARHLVDVERQRYQDLFELAPDAYLVTNPTGIITEANQSASRLLRQAPASLPGKALAAYIVNEDRSRFRSLLSQHQRDPHPHTVSFTLQPRQSRPIHTEFTFSIGYDPDGHETGIRWLIRDVSDQERLSHRIRALNTGLEQKVAERTADLRAAQRLSEDLLIREQAARRAAEASEAQSRHVQKLESIGVLAGGIAHDFNNLLHVVLGNADLALNRLPRTAAAREPLEEVVRATLRAADLTRQLLAYSGKGAFVVRHLDLSQEVRDMATLLRTAISKQAVLAWELAPKVPAIEADATQIRQIVMNLITNASDALGDAAGTITLRTGVVRSESINQNRFDPPSRDEDGNAQASETYVYLEVGDTGSGMSPDTLARIFDPFFSTKYAGRGLGLAAVMGIVRAHRGLIRIRTGLGEGTSFRILFPPSGKASQPMEVPSAARPEWRGSGTVLVVDDEEGVREVAERMLQEIGFHTIAAVDGRHALEVIERLGSEITAVLLDLSMPRMGGRETLLRLRAIRPDLPVVMTSGYTEQVVAQQLDVSEDPMVGFLQKPFLPEDLSLAFRRSAEVPH